MAISTFKRYENKYLITKEQYNNLTPKLLAHMVPDEYCTNGKYYTIYNIYYDTLDSSVIRQSLSKPYYKEKLRLRSYNVPISPDSMVYLELKKKIGGLVNKRRAAISLDEAYAFINRGVKPETKDYLKSQVLDEIAFFLQMNSVTPAVYIGYNRTAYFGKANRDFRITFDTGITTRRDELYLERGCFGESLLLPNQYLMEVKISDSIPIWFAEALSSLEIYSTSFSKYGQEYRKCLQKVI